MSIFNFFKKAVNTVAPGTIAFSFSDLIDDAYAEMSRKGNHYWWGLKANESTVFNEKILTLSDKEKANFIVESIRAYHKTNSGRTTWASNDVGLHLASIRDSFMRHLLRTKINFEEEDLVAITNSFVEYRRFGSHENILRWPVASHIGQVEKYLKDNKLGDRLLVALKELFECLNKPVGHEEKNRLKLVERLGAIFFKSENEGSAIKPTWFPADDEFAAYANQAIQALKEDDQAHLFRLMQLSSRASGSTPSKKYLDDAKSLFKEMGVDKFKLIVNDWFRFITNMKEIITTHHNTGNGNNYDYTTSEFIAAGNTDMIKGFVWICTHFHDKSTLFNIAALAERVYRKIPGKGPAAPSIGNACLYVLANSKGLDGVGHLSRLKLRIKQSSTQSLIEKYLDKAASKQNVSIHEIEDMAVDDYGLENGSRNWEFEDYKAVFKITGVGKSSVSWIKPDDSPQKSVPSFVKHKHSAKLKKMSDTIKQIEVSTTTQRDRLDRMLKLNRSLSWQQFNDFYFSHGLISYLSRKLIWTFTENDKVVSAIYLDDKWVDPSGNLSFHPGESTLISLWHPVFHTVLEIQSWRNFLLDKQLVQPLKQAFREVYLLTDAEISTRIYSNRMAAHILKQHQFNSLAKARGWKYALMGAFDNGIDSDKASITLPDYNLKAEFWINEVNAEDALNDTGIWLYVATDQVRFVRLNTNEVVDMIDVPALPFSEIMRDVDLFVGVASVGNDPQWRDSGGLVQYRDYWQTYSFGDLTEVAKTRKTLLERLVPRLKIAAVAEIKDKFLVVKGRLRTYKIHLGSTNILMEPNDQYLCIVPERSAKTTGESLFLPFEGDNAISVIISKALLLADDDKITDQTITRQINRK